MTIFSMHDLIEAVRRAAASDDELDQLATASNTVTEVNDNADAVLGYFVDQARRSGRSWVEISGVLGVSRQAVHKRFADPGQPSMERFTPRTKVVLEAAPNEAVAAGHNYVGTEHLLLAQFAEPEAVAAKILVAAGITRDRVHAAIQPVVPDRAEPFEGRPVFTPRAGDALTGALSEAVQLGHNYIGTEHLLLALYRDSEGLAYQLLHQLGLGAEAARTNVAAFLTRVGN